MGMYIDMGMFAFDRSQVNKFWKTLKNDIQYQTAHYEKIGRSKIVIIYVTMI